ncbi:MAG TPA: GDSL-type esterase/lipase family protein [Opitutaceae bacterium]
MTKLLGGLGLAVALAGCAGTSNSGAPAPAPATQAASVATAPVPAAAAGVPVAPLGGAQVTETARVPYQPADMVFPGKGKTSSWKQFWDHNAQRRAWFAANKEKDLNSLVFVGDSITEGWNSLLQTDFSDLSVKVVNRGIGGDTTPNLLYRLDDDILSLHPIGLVILIGTNDLGEHTPVSDVAYNLHLLRLRIRERYPNIPIVWCLVMPRKAEDNYPARIQLLNSNIRAEAAEDPLVTVVDTYTPLALPDGTSNPIYFKPDRLHLIESGYQVWDRALHPVLEKWHR